MEYEVVVVGGGIGGLTVAALLAARGVSVGLFERQSQGGGCVANFEFQGYKFEPTSGLYTGWEPGGIHERIFSELPVQPPEVRRLSPAYLVRLPDHTDIKSPNNRKSLKRISAEPFPNARTRPFRFIASWIRSPAPGSKRMIIRAGSNQALRFALQSCSALQLIRPPRIFATRLR